jgi:Uma2 family endonuclease
MATVVMDRTFAELLREERAAAGSDRWDEVWEGTYMMAPLPNIEHQQIANRLAAVCLEVVGWNSGAIVLAGTNVSDRVTGWEHNYRCPDVAIYFPGNPAKNCSTHWCGGPDFAIEITSDDDRTRDKLPFYGKVSTRELLVIDRDPWQLELFRLSRKTLKSVGKSTIRSKGELRLMTLPLALRLKSGESRPVILATHSADGRKWNV